MLRLVQCYLVGLLSPKTLNERFANRKDPDYFYSYENPHWRPTPWYNRLLYFISGPKFVVSILGFVIKRFLGRFSKRLLSHFFSPEMIRNEMLPV